MQMFESRQWLGLTLIAAAAIRSAALQPAWDSFSADPDSYGRLAVTLRTTGTYGFGGEGSGVDSVVHPTAYRPPLYPALLTLAVRNGQLDHTLVAAIHVVLGIATVLLTLGIAQRLRFRWPFVPALAVACDPLLLRGSQLLMTETLVTFLSVAIWFLWLVLLRPKTVEGESRRRRARWTYCWVAVLGVMLGASILTRPTMLPWAICLIVLLGIRRSDCGQRLALVALSGLMTFMVVLPWAARNNRYLGKPIWTTTHSGYTLLLANNPLLYQHFRAKGNDRNWDASDFHQHWAARRQGDPTQLGFWTAELPISTLDPPIEELADDRLAQKAAVSAIQANVKTFAFATSCLFRASWLWAVAPNEGSFEIRLAIGLWYGFWFLCAIIGIFKIGFGWYSRLWLAPAALVLSLTLIHAIFWSNMRMRAPIMPMVYIAAAIPLLRRP